MFELNECDLTSLFNEEIIWMPYNQTDDKYFTIV